MLKKLKNMFKTDLEEVPKGKEHDLSLAVSALMIEIMHIDGEMADAEYVELNKSLQKRFSLSDAETQSLIEKAQDASEQATDFHQFSSQIKDNYSTEERIGVLKDLWRIAMADGHIDSHEEHLIRRVANLIGVYHAEFIQAKIAARD
ncbi:MAG: TerB family tellurite resistance protein [Ghiorsea sp.]